MENELLRTKLYIPHLHADLVSRPHLLRRLNDGLRRKLTLISAPAGFGKTTLLCEWVAQNQMPVAWLSLDENDNDPARFLTYFIAALQTIAPQVEGIEPDIGANAVNALRSPQPPPVDTVLTTLINHIAAIPKPFMFVLDDYHAITTPSIHQAIAFLLANFPPSMHLTIASRADPPLPLARLRAQGQLTELRLTDLRFTLDETAAFLSQVMGLKLAAADIAALENRTEGWIAGLQMAALSMQGRDDTANFISAFTGSNRFILDYLTEEVLEQQTAHVRSFLLKTAILNRLSTPLCNAVLATDTENTDTQTTLARLEASNLFVVPLDDERRWYRYHHLFADLLRLHLRHTHPDQISVLHQRAFEWYKTHHLYQEALHHAFAGQHFEAAANLIETVGNRMMARGSLTTVQKWLTALPEELVRQHPKLCVLHAWTLDLTNQWAQVEPRLQDAERAIAAAETSTAMADLRGQIAAIRAYDARRQNNLPLSIQRLQEAQTYLAPDNLMVKTAVNQSLGQAYLFAGNLTAAADAFHKAQLLGEASGNALSGLVAVGQQAAILIAQGHLHQAAEICRAAIRRYLERHNEPSPVLCHPYAFLGQIFYEWGEPDKAATYLSQSVLWSNQIGYGQYGAPVRLMTAFLAWVQHTQTMRGAPLSLPAAVNAILARVPEDAGMVDIGAWRVRLWLAQNNLALATRWADTCQTDKYPPGVWPLYGKLALARVQIARQTPAPALDMLKDIRQTAEKAGGTGWLIAALVLESLIHWANGQTARARASLERALTLAAPEGYIRTFVDEGAAMRELLLNFRKQIAHQPKPKLKDYVAKLVASFPDAAPATVSIPASPQPQPALIEPLSERELEVLHLIATGFSNQEIADELFVAIGTVKKHTNNIYGKLGVRNRTQAILRATELKLLPPR